MAHTTTLNPTLGWGSLAEKLGFADANRIEQEQRYAGGNGIDVPKMLALAGFEQ